MCLDSTMLDKMWICGAQFIEYPHGPGHNPSAPQKKEATTRLPKDIEMVTKLKYFDLSSDWPLHLEYVLILVTFY